jgi:hypothetical protein
MVPLLFHSLVTKVVFITWESEGGEWGWKKNGNICYVFSRRFYFIMGWHYISTIQGNIRFDFVILYASG